MAQIERQELHCHDCGKYIQFDLDLEIEGNHVLECPVCKHQHCRVVQKGKVSDTRWDARNGSDKSKGDKPNPESCQLLKGGLAPEKLKKEDSDLTAISIPKTAFVGPKTTFVGPNGLPIVYVSTSTIQWTNKSTYTVYQGTGTGNVYLYMSWMNSITSAV